MHKMSTAELRELEVINLCGGTRLGYPSEFEIDTKNARIISMTVTRGGMNLFCKKEEYVIPWQMIECIGEDAILIKLTADELEACCSATKKKGRNKLGKM